MGASVGVLSIEFNIGTTFQAFTPPPLAYKEGPAQIFKTLMLIVFNINKTSLFRIFSAI